ncbi:MAG: 50S ribosomal protein L14e [Candidatus Micrarchaeota archaeon]|nr:50S ribosomal protein L14e [Candidatus Micrarchaeota archaeon]
MIEPGRVCVKIAGREAGRCCVVLEVQEDGKFALVHGPGVRKRRCNVLHLEPLAEKIEPKGDYLKKLSEIEEKLNEAKKG